MHFRLAGAEGRRKLCYIEVGCTLGLREGNVEEEEHFEEVVEGDPDVERRINIQGVRGETEGQEGPTRR